MARVPKSNPTQKPKAALSNAAQTPAAPQEQERLSETMGVAESVQATPKPLPSFTQIALFALVAGAFGGVLSGSLIAKLSPAINVPMSNNTQYSQPAPAKDPSRDFDALLKTRDEKQAALEARLQGEIGKLATSLAALRQPSSPPSPAEPSNTGQSPHHAEVEAKLATLQAALAKLEQTSSALLRHQVATSRHNAVKQLADAFETGKPLKIALESLKTYGISQAQLEALRVFEAEGAPNAAPLIGKLGIIRAKISASLAKERAEAEKQAVAQHAQEKAANPQPDAPSGIFDRLLAQSDDAFARIKQQMTSLVDIRPKKDKNDATKHEPSTLESALNEGDYRTALTTLDALPEKEKAEFSAFRAKLEALLSAREALNKLLADAQTQVKANPLPSLP